MNSDIHKGAQKRNKLSSVHYRNLCIETVSIILLLTLLLGFTPSGAGDEKLELSLNNVTHAIIYPANFGIGTEGIPLQTLFPYLETVEYLEAKSEQGSASWDAARLGPAGWNEALLKFSNQTCILHVGSNTFTSPRRISVHGIRKPINSVQIWSSIHNPQYKSDLLAALTLRDVEVKWEDVSKLANRLENPPPQGMPHLVIVDQIHLLRLDSLLTSPHPIMTKFSQWYSVTENREKGMRIAIDAYHPESALLYLLAENPDLFDKHNRLPDSLVTFLNRVAMSRGLVESASPMASLVNSAESQVTGSVSLPSSEEEIGRSFKTVEPPAGAVNIISYIYATIPSDIRSEQEGHARLILEDAARLANIEIPLEAVAIPRDPRIPRFFDAYTRIGRLAISKQISAAKASELINAYVASD